MHDVSLTYNLQDTIYILVWRYNLSTYHTKVYNVIESGNCTSLKMGVKHFQKIDGSTELQNSWCWHCKPSNATDIFMLQGIHVSVKFHVTNHVLLLICKSLFVPSYCTPMQTQSDQVAHKITITPVNSCGDVAYWFVATRFLQNICFKWKLVQCKQNMRMHCNSLSFETTLIQISQFPSKLWVRCTQSVHNTYKSVGVYFLYMSIPVAWILSWKVVHDLLQHGRAVHNVVGQAGKQLSRMVLVA